MKHTVATAAATACTIAWSLLAALHIPEAAPVVFVAMSPRSVIADETVDASQSPLEPARATETPKSDDRDIRPLIAHYAQKYGVNEEIMRFTVSCETGGTFDASIQSGARYGRDHPEWSVKKGDRELSYGLAQIHMPSNPGVTIAQATDPDYALDFMARSMAAAEYWRWSCLK